MLRQFAWKMSANDGATIASNPHSWSDHGACSRELPDPKFGPATRMTASVYSGRLRTNAGSGSPSASRAQS